MINYVLTNDAGLGFCKAHEDYYAKREVCETVKTLDLFRSYPIFTVIVTKENRGVQRISCCENCALKLTN